MTLRQTLVESLSTQSGHQTQDELELENAGGGAVADGDFLMWLYARAVFAFVLVYSTAALAQSAGIQPPAPPRVSNVSETIHAETRVDPYRWMEAGGVEFKSWARKESDFTTSTLNRISGRSKLYSEIKALDVPPPGVSALQSRAGRFVYERLSPDGNERILVAREGLHGAERELRLLESLPASEGPWSEVSHARVLSPDGRYLAFGTTRRGEADPAIRVYDLVDGRVLPDVIDWPLWADSSGFRPRWLADSSGFFYVRNPAATASMDDRDRARKGQVFLHRLGQPMSDDRALFGYGITAGIEETDTLYVEGEPDARWLTVLRRQPEGRDIWAADLHQFGSGAMQFRRVYQSDVLARDFGTDGNWLYTLDADGAPRFRLIRVDLSRAGSPLEEVLRPQDGVFRELHVGADGVYVVESLLNQAKLHRLHSGAMHSIELPAGAVDAIGAGVDGRGLWVEISTWLAPKRGWLLDADTQNVRPFPGDAPSSVRDKNNVTELGWATARDGVRIPYTIVRRTNAPRDGSGFVYMSGYGCFGAVNSPFYWPALNAWLDRGGLFVQVAMRGGGELGAEWHAAGRDRHKPTSSEDAVDTIRHLIRERLTRPGRVAVAGGSCGGITMGMAALDAPHLIRAAYLSVGAFDLGRMAETTAAGARSVREVGDPKTAHGWRRINALSPYWQLLPGVPRPALLIGNGATDYTIPLWVGGKMVAHARATNPAGLPVLWRIEWEAGHSIGTDYAKEDADVMAFMLWQLGHPQFTLTDAP